jgi:hypothetical protein
MSEDRAQSAAGTAAGGGPGSAPGEPAGPVSAIPEDAVVRRTRDGWRVGNIDVPDLTCAMVLADLLAAELPEPAASGPGDSQSLSGPSASGQSVSSQSVSSQSVSSQSPSGQQLPGQSAGTRAAPIQAADEPAAASEASKLRATVGQLERALTARIRVEQAIGVLAERHRIQPRQAFEQLRTAARNRGRRVIDIAADVVASATNPLLQLPDELARPRSSAKNRSRQPRGALDSD